MGRPPSIPRTLIVTADFPPTVGGVQRYVHDLARHLPPDDVTVLTGTHTGWEESDAAQPFRVVRAPGKWLWPAGALTRRILGVADDMGAEVVLFASGYPAAMVGPEILRAGLPYLVVTHGVEYWIATVPGGAALMRAAFRHASRVVAISRFTAAAIRRAVPAGVPLTVCHPGVDIERFRPDVDGTEVRLRHRIGTGRPLVVCVSRFVRRKGQDVLVRGMQLVRRRVPEATLLLAGTGPDHARIEGLARRLPRGAVHFAGVIPDEELPQYHAAADVFAMPCRTRRMGLEVEGFGMVFAEAAACGKAVVAGRSGGAAEAVVDGETGVVVDGTSVRRVAEATAGLLLDPGRAAELGKAGRARAEQELSWTAVAERFAGWLHGAVGSAGEA